MVAAIVIGVYFSMAASNQVSAAARVGDMASDLSERMRLVFAPAVPVVRAAAATCVEFGVNLTSWDRLGTAMFKVRARRDTHTRKARSCALTAARMSRDGGTVAGTAWVWPEHRAGCREGAGWRSHAPSSFPLTAVRARAQVLQPYALVLLYVEILPTAAARAAWEARLTTEYGRHVFMRDAYSEARPADSTPPLFWGYAAGSNGSLVRARATLGRRMW